MSVTGKTKVRRALKLRKAGRDRKKKMVKEGTPKFPIHPPTTGE